MSLQTDRPADTWISRKPGHVQQPLHIRWMLTLLLAIVIAVVAGVVVAAHLTGPPASTPTVYHEPNANTREGRVPAATIQEPNANTREGRVPAATIQEPNANTREGRLPTPTVQEPNANTREGRDSGNG
jgi:hypothetical protein